jgi:hypothetical protein
VDNQIADRGTVFSWPVLAGAGAAFLLLGGLASLAMPSDRRRLPVDALKGMPKGISGRVSAQQKVLRDLGEKSRGTSQGLSTVLEGIWDNVMEAGSSARARTKVTGSGLGGTLRKSTATVRKGTETIGEGVGDVAGSVSNAAGSAVGSLFGFVFSTISAVLWLAAAGSVVLILYYPDPDRRERFLGQLRRWLNLS